MIDSSRTVQYCRRMTGDYNIVLVEMWAGRLMVLCLSVV